jgi:hypothetical protein
MDEYSELSCAKPGCAFVLRLSPSPKLGENDSEAAARLVFIKLAEFERLKFSGD